MLQAGLPRSAVLRQARAQRRVNGRCLVCRSTESDASSSVPTLDRPVVAEDAKVKSTISSLDALLGSKDTPTAASSRTTSSVGASTSAPQPPKLPSLPLGGPSASSPASPARKPAGLTFDQVMGFSGLAPEVINGRAAMIGFFLAISHELNNGESVFSQMVSGGAGQALIVFLVVTIASFAPAIRGKPLDEVFNKVPKKVTEWGPFTAFAEDLNGRLAMVGLGLLLFFEGAGPTAFFMN